MVDDLVLSCHHRLVFRELPYLLVVFVDGEIHLLLSLVDLLYASGDLLEVLGMRLIRFRVRLGLFHLLPDGRRRRSEFGKRRPVDIRQHGVDRLCRLCHAPCLRCRLPGRAFELKDARVGFLHERVQLSELLLVGDVRHLPPEVAHRLLQLAETCLVQVAERVNGVLHAAAERLDSGALLPYLLVERSEVFRVVVLATQQRVFLAFQLVQAFLHGFQLILRLLGVEPYDGLKFLRVS